MVSWLDDAQDEDDEFIEAAKAIRLLALDVDGVLTDGTIYIAADGECFKGFNAKDGMGISCALHNGLEVAIITGRKSEIIHRRAEELGITTIIEGAKDKREALRSLRRLRGLSVEEVAYVGDDYGLGGNDESVYKSDFNYITIDNYLDFPKKVKEL